LKKNINLDNKYSIIMRFFILLFMSSICCITSVYSQTKRMSDVITHEDRVALDNLIMEIFKTTKCYDKHKTYTMSPHIFAISSTRPRYKQDFIDGSFVENLKAEYRMEKMSRKRTVEHLFVFFTSYIYEDGNLVGISDVSQTGCISEIRGYVVPHRKAIEYFNTNDLTYFILHKASIRVRQIYEVYGQIYVE